MRVSAAHPRWQLSPDRGRLILACPAILKAAESAPSEALASAESRMTVESCPAGIVAGLAVTPAGQSFHTNLNRAVIASDAVGAYGDESGSALGNIGIFRLGAKFEIGVGIVNGQAVGKVLPLPGRERP